MINIIKSEIYKIKGTWLPWIHIVLPIAYSLLFYVASKTTGLKNFEERDIIQTYFVLLGALMPIILSFISSKVVDMEMSAGKFQVLLSTTKSRSLYRKTPCIRIGICYFSRFSYYNFCNTNWISKYLRLAY